MAQVSVEDEPIDYDDFPAPQTNERGGQGSVLKDVSASAELSPEEQELRDYIAEIRSSEGSLMALRQSEREAA